MLRPYQISVMEIEGLNILQKYLDARQDNSRYTLFSLLFLLGIGAFWIFYAYHSGLDLAPDEAYYWDWSRKLDWGYYEKPPLVAWSFALVKAILGSTTFSIRAGNAFITIGTVLGILFLVKRTFASRVGLWTVVTIVLTPGMAAAAFIFTIDTPLMFFWTWGCFITFLAVLKKTWLLWILSGVFIGAACLAKQVAMIFPFALVFVLFISPAHRNQLRSPKVWTSIFISYAMLLPPLIWNHGHDWITFSHSAHHVEIDPTHLVRPNLFFEYLGSQAGLLGPVLFVLVFIALWLYLKKGVLSLGFRNTFLIFLSYPALLGFHFISLFSRVHPNWPDTFYITAYPLTVAWAMEKKDDEEIGKMKKRKLWLAIGICVGALFTFLTYYPSVLSELGFPLTAKTDPTIRLSGWSELGEEVGQVAEGLEQTQQWKQGNYFFFSNKRDYVCELAFYLPGQPRVFFWVSKPKLETQYQVWGGLERRYGQNGIFVTRDGSPIPGNLVACFGKVEHLKTLEIKVRDGVVKRHDIFLFYNLKKLPPFYFKFMK